MGLPFSLHLDAIFEPAQEVVGGEEAPRLLAGEQADFPESAQGALGGSFPNLGDAGAVQELQSLGDELDVANATGIRKPIAQEITIMGATMVTTPA